mgnify:FL=1|jgi:hypothetical protein
MQIEKVKIVENVKMVHKIKSNNILEVVIVVLEIAKLLNTVIKVRENLNRIGEIVKKEQAHLTVQLEAIKVIINNIYLHLKVAMLIQLAPMVILRKIVTVTYQLIVILVKIIKNINKKIQNNKFNLKEEMGGKENFIKNLKEEVQL